MQNKLIKLAIAIKNISPKSSQKINKLAGELIHLDKPSNEDRIKQDIKDLKNILINESNPLTIETIKDQIAELSKTRGR
jgi:hypothetical protein